MTTRMEKFHSNKADFNERTVPKKRPTIANNPLRGFHPSCVKCGYPLLHNEEECPQCGIKIQISQEELARQQRMYMLHNNKAYKISQGLNSFGNGAQKVGNTASSIGNMLTLIITVPIVIIFLILMFM